MNIPESYPIIDNDDLYSYDYAKRSRPEAWKITVRDLGYKCDNGRPATRTDVQDIAPKGLGTWAIVIRDYGPGFQWVYVEPNGYARPVHDNYGKATPPELPRPRAGWRKCGCSLNRGYGRGVHICSACGKPYWNESHGNADGSCSYCYHAG